MSAQRLGAKKLRRIAEAVGEPVRIGWAHGGYSFAFATESHRHGFYDSKTGEVAWAAPDDARVHYSSCYGDEWPEHLRAVQQAPRPRAARRPPYRTVPAVEPLEPEYGPDELIAGPLEGQVAWVPAGDLARQHPPDIAGTIRRAIAAVTSAPFRPTEYDPVSPRDYARLLEEAVGVPAVEGEVLDALPDPCPHCPHPLSLHLKGRLTCMYSTDEEPWACDCRGPADQPDDDEGCQPSCESHEPGGAL